MFEKKLEIHQHSPVGLNPDSSDGWYSGTHWLHVQEHTHTHKWNDSSIMKALWRH